MTIVLDVSFNDQSDSQNSAINEISRKKAKHNACSSKAVKVAKVKNKVRIVDIFYLLRTMSAINCNRELRNVLVLHFEPTFFPLIEQQWASRKLCG